MPYLKVVQTPLRLTGSVRTTSRLTHWGHIGILGALGVLSCLESRFLMNSPKFRASAGGTTLQAMQTHLDGVSLGIKTYLESHDPQSLERIKGEGKEATRLLGEFREEALQNGDADAYSRMEKAHEDFREATLKILAVDNAAVRSRQGLKESNEALMSVLVGSMEASIRPSQLSSSARLRAVRTAIAEAKNVPGDPGRFRKAIDTYEELSRTRRAGRWAEEARNEFNRRLTLANDLQQADAQKQAAFDQYQEKRKALDTLSRGGSTGRVFARGMAVLRQVTSSGFACAALSGGIAILGIVLVIRTQRRTERNWVQPLEDILQCVEAAAAGDVSRVPDHWAADEVGQLSQAVGRLISVLARSENLVYHLAALVESSGDAIVSHTLDGTILSWNKGAQRIYGYSAEEVKGRSIGILSPDDGGIEMMEILRRIRNGEHLQPFETIHQASNGRNVRAFVRVAAIYDSTRRIIGASFIAQDLSDTILLQPKHSKRNHTV